MKRLKVSIGFCIAVNVLFMIGLVLLFAQATKYPERLRWTEIFLKFSRDSIRLFAEQNGRFPESLQELNEYGEKHGKIYWRGPPKEFISSHHPDYSEHDELDGTGGLYYNSKTGELKLNLTRPLKSYWRFCLGEKRDNVPADW